MSLRLAGNEPASNLSLQQARSHTSAKCRKPSATADLASGRRSKRRMTVRIPLPLYPDAALLCCIYGMSTCRRGSFAFLAHGPPTRGRGSFRRVSQPADERVTGGTGLTFTLRGGGRTGGRAGGRDEEYMLAFWNQTMPRCLRIPLHRLASSLLRPTQLSE